MQVPAADPAQQVFVPSVFAKGNFDISSCFQLGLAPPTLDMAATWPGLFGSSAVPAAPLTPPTRRSSGDSSSHSAPLVTPKFASRAPGPRPLLTPPSTAGGRSPVVTPPAFKAEEGITKDGVPFPFGGARATTQTYDHIKAAYVSKPLVAGFGALLRLPYSRAASAWSGPPGENLLGCFGDPATWEQMVHRDAVSLTWRWAVDDKYVVGVDVASIAFAVALFGGLDFLDRTDGWASLGAFLTETRGWPSEVHQSPSATFFRTFGDGSMASLCAEDKVPLVDQIKALYRVHVQPNEAELLAWIARNGSYQGIALRIRPMHILDGVAQSDACIALTSEVTYEPRIGLGMPAGDCGIEHQHMAYGLPKRELAFFIGKYIKAHPDRRYLRSKAKSPTSKRSPQADKADPGSPLKHKTSKSAVQLAPPTPSPIRFNPLGTVDMAHGSAVGSLTTGRKRVSKSLRGLGLSMAPRPAPAPLATNKADVFLQAPPHDFQAWNSTPPKPRKWDLLPPKVPAKVVPPFIKKPELELDPATAARIIFEMAVRDNIVKLVERVHLLVYHSYLFCDFLAGGIIPEVPPFCSSEFSSELVQDFLLYAKDLYARFRIRYDVASEAAEYTSCMGRLPGQVTHDAWSRAIRVAQRTVRDEVTPNVPNINAAQVIWVEFPIGRGLGPFLPIMADQDMMNASEEVFGGLDTGPLGAEDFPTELDPMALIDMPKMPFEEEFAELMNWDGPTEVTTTSGAQGDAHTTTQLSDVAHAPINEVTTAVHTGIMLGNGPTGPFSEDTTWTPPHSAGPDGFGCGLGTHLLLGARPGQDGATDYSSRAIKSHLFPK